MTYFIEETRQKSSLCSTEAKAFLNSGNWEILY